MSRRLKIHRSAVCVSTAVVMLNSILSFSAHAAGRSEFALSADKSSVRAGDTVEVSVRLSPDTDGASGFTLCLHYDPSEVQVYVPSADESGFGGDSDFTVITNYGYSPGVVKIVGADLKGGNITADGILSKARFTVLDSADGDLDYWIEVENIVRWDGKGFEYIDCIAPYANSPFSIDVEEVPVTAAVQPAVTASAEPVTQPAEEKNELSRIPPVTEAPQCFPEVISISEDPVISEETQETTWYYEEPEPDTWEPEVLYDDNGEPLYTEDITEETEPCEEPEYAGPEVPQTSGEPVFSYFKDPSAEDYTDDTVQYAFNAYDYISDTDISYDIKVYVNSSGYLNGAVGMDTDFGWDCAEYLIPEGGEQCWVYEDYDPKVSEETVYMQVYYLSDYTGFDITGIEFVPRGEWYAPEDMTDEVTEIAAEEPVSYEDLPISSEDTESAADEECIGLYAEAEVSEAPLYIPEKSTADVVSSAETADEVSSAAEAVSSAPESEAEISSSPESKAEDPSSEASKAPMREEIKPAVPTATETSTPEKVLDTVDKASKQAESRSASNANPNTGSAGDIGRKLFKGIYYASTAYFVYLIFALVYNHTKRDR